MQDRPRLFLSRITPSPSVSPISFAPAALNSENPQGKRWYEMSQKSPEEGVKAAIEAGVSMQTGTPVFHARRYRVAPPEVSKIEHPAFSRRCHEFE